MQLNIKENQSIKLINNLFNIDNNKEYFKKYKMRHPGELVLQQMDRTNLTLNRLLKAKDLDNFDKQKEKAIFEYTLALNSLNESLLSVIKVLTEPCSENDNSIKEIDKWLKKYNLENYTKFKDATFNDNDFIRTSANNIKHGDIKIDYIEITNHKNKKVKGFYFSTILDEEELSGAKVEIHPLYKGYSSAFSFNHFILRTAGVVALNVYWINKILFKKIKSKAVNGNSFYSYFMMIAKIEKDFFPDEYHRKYAHIILNKNMISIDYIKHTIPDDYHLILGVNSTHNFNYQGKSNVSVPYMTLLNNR